MVIAVASVSWNQLKMNIYIGPIVFQFKDVHNIKHLYTVKEFCVQGTTVN